LFSYNPDFWLKNLPSGEEEDRDHYAQDVKFNPDQQIILQFVGSTVPMVLALQLQNPG
jgi:hypothetical protein